MGDMTMGELKAWLDAEIKKYEESRKKEGYIFMFSKARYITLKEVREAVGP